MWGTTAILTVLLAISIIAAINLSPLVTAHEDRGASTDKAGIANNQFSDRTIHYITEIKANYDHKPIDDSLPAAAKAAQSHTITEKWARTDGDGRITRSRSVTRLPDGTLWQDQTIVGNVNTINYYGWNGSGLACSETVILPRVGAAVDSASPESLATEGYAPSSDGQALSMTTSGIERTAFAVERDESLDSFPASRTVVVVARDTQQVLGIFAFGLRPGEERHLLTSRVSSPAEVLPSVDEAVFQMPALERCRHEPTTR